MTHCATRELRMNLSQRQPQVVSFSHAHLRATLLLVDDVISQVKCCPVYDLDKVSAQVLQHNFSRP